MPRYKMTLAVSAASDFLLGVILLYGYVYSSYKLGNPLFGRNDFFKYALMIGRPFDYSATTAPFVLRQIPTIIASLFYKSGVHYNTSTTAALLAFDEDAKRRFLSLILSNGLAVCLSFAILSGYLRTKAGPRTSLAAQFAIFGIFAAWFYFPSGVIAPLTLGWGWVASSLFIIGLLERSIAFTCVGCAIALFSRETTLVFALTMFLAVIWSEPDSHPTNVISALVLTLSCLIYLSIRMLFTAGYEHQIIPRMVVLSFLSFRISREFLFQSILSQGELLLLLGCIAVRRPRYALYLIFASLAIAIVAIGAHVTDLGFLWGETLPFYAVLFLLTRHDDGYELRRQAQS